MIAILRDVSDRVEHRLALEKKIERLDRFASIVSHDLRNPLSIIQGRLTLARETGDPEHFDAIEEAVDRMDEMLSELLQLTRKGDVIGDRTFVELETLARQAWPERDIDTGTLEIESSRVISADRSRVCELFENLFENALEHAGADVTVRIGTIETAYDSGFYIEDDGVGIPTDERDTVFEWGPVEFGFGTQTAHGTDEYTTTEALARNAISYGTLPVLYDRLTRADG